MSVWLDILLLKGRYFRRVVEPLPRHPGRLQGLQVNIGSHVAGYRGEVREGRGFFSYIFFERRLVKKMFTLVLKAIGLQVQMFKSVFNFPVQLIKKRKEEKKK